MSRVWKHDRWMRPNALVQLQARYNHCGEAASEKCLSAATIVRPQARRRCRCNEGTEAGLLRSVSHWRWMTVRIGPVLL